VCILDRSWLNDSMLGLHTRRGDPAAKTRLSRRGIVTGRNGRMFAWLARKRPDLELLGQQLSAGQPATGFDILFWNSDTTRFRAVPLRPPRTVRTTLPKAGNMKIGGLPIDLRQVQVGPP